LPLGAYLVMSIYQ